MTFVSAVGMLFLASSPQSSRPMGQNWVECQDSSDCYQSSVYKVATRDIPVSNKQMDESPLDFFGWNAVHDAQSPKSSMASKSPANDTIMDSQIEQDTHLSWWLCWKSNAAIFGQVCANSSQPIGACFCILLGKIVTVAYRLTQSTDSVSQALHSCITTFRLTRLGFQSCKSLLLFRDVRAEHFEHASILAF